MPISGIDIAGTPAIGARTANTVYATRDVNPGEVVFWERPAVFVTTINNTVKADLCTTPVDREDLVRGYSAIVPPGTDPLMTLAAALARSSATIKKAPTRRPAWKQDNPLFDHECRRICHIDDAKAKLPIDEERLDEASDVACGCARLVTAPMSGMALGWAAYTRALCHINHACDANATVVFENDGVARVVATRFIPKNSEVCVSLLPTSADRSSEGRLAAINDILLDECTCAACCINAEPDMAVDWDYLRTALPKRAYTALKMAADQVPLMMARCAVRSANRIVVKALEEARAAGVVPLSDEHGPAPTEYETKTALAGVMTATLFVQTQCDPVKQADLKEIDTYARSFLKELYRYDPSSGGASTNNIDTPLREEIAVAAYAVNGEEPPDDIAKVCKFRWAKATTDKTLRKQIAC